MVSLNPSSGSSLNNVIEKAFVPLLFVCVVGLDLYCEISKEHSEQICRSGEECHDWQQGWNEIAYYCPHTTSCPSCFDSWIFMKTTFVMLTPPPPSWSDKCIFGTDCCAGSFTWAENYPYCSSIWCWKVFWYPILHGRVIECNRWSASCCFWWQGIMLHSAIVNQPSLCFHVV